VGEWKRIHSLTLAATAEPSQSQLRGIGPIANENIGLSDSGELGRVQGIECLQPLAGVPVMRLEHCPGAIVRASRAFAGTGTFLSTLPGELKGLVLQGDVLDGAQRPTEASAAPDTPQISTLRN